MVVKETSVFTRKIKEIMSDEQYQLLQEALIAQPNLGVVIQGHVVFVRRDGVLQIQVKAIVENWTNEN